MNNKSLEIKVHLYTYFPTYTITDTQEHTKNEQTNPTDIIPPTNAITDSQNPTTSNKKNSCVINDQSQQVTTISKNNASFKQSFLIPVYTCHYLFYNWYRFQT